MPDQHATTVATDTPIRPAFDAELAPALEVAREALLPFSAENLPLLRQAMIDGIPGMEQSDLTAGGLVTVEEREVPGPAGEPDITVLILRPANPAGSVAGIYHTHGGGMVVGDRRSGADMFVPLVAEGKAVVVSVEYRLAPEHPDPAPVEDCYAGLVWTANNAAELGIDPRRLLIVGASAGGGLAAGTALLARDRQFPTLSHQVLICPMLDDRLETHSSRMLDGEGVWDRNDNLYGWTALLGERRGGPAVSPYAAPARAEDLTGLPRTYIDTGSAESFRDEAVTYATRLSQAGVVVDLHMWGGGFHGFDLMAAHAAVSQASRATRDEYLRRAVEG
ncbi:alpha/beta hydrolase [Dactylosporangium sp. AC04546]|uniref:alpha/beta hydrolase n=1 Tax=Dactylosporangium sp. AC04546 TaxID=2862460 RepID=UPI001EE08B94|nr:alpha/beta hydrolase [Dactylosporangium sp. AC04546]WVK80358.1 alpha/beta hydrolase [Dactylosporangium sp. AC04546]